ncbi:MAG: zinc dependent phospholipase C family protein [Leptospiraceae bacterium]|nr:zinc dependent phospholipase C family protein [Leptospiraceae bacterium]
MAARLTHLEVLKQSLHHMEHDDGRKREIAFALRDPALFSYAALGSVAPDMYYFYHLTNSLRNRKALFWGNLAHHSRVFEVVLAMLDELKNESQGSQHQRKLAFVLGYLSHCATDIITHPFIFYITGDYYSADPKKAARAQAKHIRVEYALDSWLVHHKWGMSVRKYNYLQYVSGAAERNIDSKKQLDSAIWGLWVRALRRVFPREFEQFYIGQVEYIGKGDILNESFLGFLKFNALTDIRSRTIRFALRSLDHLTFHRLKTSLLIPPPPHKVGRRISNREKESWKYPAQPDRVSDASFIELVNESARYAEEMIADALAYVNGRERRSALEKKYLGYNLDTGIRSDSLKMESFDEVDQVDEDDPPSASS